MRNKITTSMRLLACCMLFVATAASAQTKSVPGWSADTLADLRQLHRMALEDDYVYTQLAYLTDSIGPRLTGSPQAEAAVQYVAAELRRLGLEVRLEKLTVPHWVRGEERAELVAYPGQVPGTTQKVVVTALSAPGSATPPEGVTGEVLVVNSMAEFAALPREKVAGKVVLFNLRFDQHKAESGYARTAYEELVELRHGSRLAAARQGAAASLIRSIGGAEFRLPHTGVAGYAPKVLQIAAGAIAAEDADLVARLAARGPVRMRLVLTPQLLPDITSYNVIADLKGTEHPEQVVIVSGHLDSWDLGTGALDDGAGIAIAMQTAHLLKELRLQPKRTIRVVAWMAEELGISGGFQYAREHATAIGNHFAAVESDLGAGHPVGIEAAGDTGLPALLQPVAEILSASGAGIVEHSAHTGTDIYGLYVRGVPSFQPLQDLRTYFDYQHSAADTLDKVNPRELRANAALIAVLSYALATTNLELPRQQLPVPEYLK